MKLQSEQQRRLGFRIHAWSFLGTMILLVAINLWTGAPYWAAWVLPGWTVGLLCHWYFGIVRPKARLGDNHRPRVLGDRAG